MKKLFLIIGAPGSGKTTDASIIAQNNAADIAHYSTGDLLREEVASGSELGQTIDGFVSKGNLVPLEIVINTVVKAIKGSPKNVILIDGFPRSVEQMEKLDEVLRGEAEVELTNVIEVMVSEEVARDRVLGRARGADDNNEVFNNRMAVFMGPLEAIRSFYSAKNIYHTINAERTIEEIVADMEAYIKTKI
ncbi:MAG TPA: adenylate kinase [Campylobacterales bacterium]|nr:adenylate kinase [Campylobacterales bacterium]